MAAVNLLQPSQNTGQGDVVQPAAPPAAHMVNARVGMLRPKHYADGTASVPTDTGIRSALDQQNPSMALNQRAIAAGGSTPSYVAPAAQPPSLLGGGSSAPIANPFTPAGPAPDWHGGINHFDAAVNQATHPAAPASAGFSGVDPVPINPQHAAGNALSYLVGRMEGLFHGTTSANTAHAVATGPQKLPSDPVPNPTTDPANTTFLRTNYATNVGGATGGGDPAGQVTVYGDSPGGPTHVRTFNNGQLTSQHGYGQGDFGTPEHAAANPHHYTEDEYVQQFAGKVPRSAFYQMVAATPKYSTQEQAAALALKMAMEGQPPEQVQALIKLLAVPGGAFTPAGQNNSYNPQPGMVTPDGTGQ
jgi:hypothetical protein